MKLQTIILNTAALLNGVSVEVNSSLEWVNITDDGCIEENIFLQGDDARGFIDELENLWNETGDLDKDTIALYLAYAYTENLWD